MTDFYPDTELNLPFYRTGESDEPGYHHIPRDHRQDRFALMLEYMLCDRYGYAQGGSKLQDFETHFADDDPMKHYVIDTPLFTIRPFYWGDSDEVYRMPNFVFKPWSLEISWYKYPFRDAYSNCHMTDDMWDELIQSCKDYYDSLCSDVLFVPPEYHDMRNEADKWATVWTKRVRKAMDSADKHYLTIERIFDGLMEADEDELQKGLNEAATIVPSFEIETKLDVISVNKNADTVIVTLKTTT